MKKHVSQIDFRPVIGQAITRVQKDKHTAFIIELEAGAIIIECSWRLVNEQGILIGYRDIIGGQYTYEQVANFIKGKRILNIVHTEQWSDLAIQLEHGRTLQLWHDSALYEGWQLSAAGGFLVVSLRGGAYDEF
ncbi:hypothetical protein [Caryophanon tenue]|uniref:Uncharacterized protein n=1 Tax=Caryophanon tenue TaxID=33978 RepID=A0A1C0YHV6_9BACL|nr:hypothetical protein [Caryophanon tenue]OCS86750.1 hypothetical protein A6M13_12375 [Caryophanon tenue]